MNKTKWCFWAYILTWYINTQITFGRGIEENLQKMSCIMLAKLPCFKLYPNMTGTTKTKLHSLLTLLQLFKEQLVVSVSTMILWFTFHTKKEMTPNFSMISTVLTSIHTLKIFYSQILKNIIQLHLKLETYLRKS